MDDFEINVCNSKGLSLTALVRYVYPDHFSVEIQDMKLTLKVLRNWEGKLECEEAEETHSILVKDVCDQINARLNKINS